MLEKTEDGYKFNTNNLTEENLLLIDKLTGWITKDATPQEIHIATIRQILHCFAYTLDYGKYTWREMARHIKNNYPLEGKTGWYIDYLMCLKEK